MLAPSNRANCLDVNILFRYISVSDILSNKVAWHHPRTRNQDAPAETVIKIDGFTFRVYNQMRFKISMT